MVGMPASAGLNLVSNLGLELLVPYKDAFVCGYQVLAKLAICPFFTKNVAVNTKIFNIFE